MSVLALLVFVVQVTTASILPCQMKMQDQSAMMDHSMRMMDHSSNMMEKQSDQSNESSMDCCTKDGTCSMSGCLSLALPAGLFEQSNPLLSSESAEQQMQFVTSEFPNYLYRPPILS